MPLEVLEAEVEVLLALVLELELALALGFLVLALYCPDMSCCSLTCHETTARGLTSLESTVVPDVEQESVH